MSDASDASFVVEPHPGTSRARGHLLRGHKVTDTGQGDTVTRRQARREPTHYLNVDLDIRSATALDTLVEAMGNKVTVLYVGGEPRRYEAHLELASSHMDMTADRTIMGLIAVVNRLALPHRRIWDRARAREFNVGIEAGLEPHGFELRLKRRTLEAITAVRATLVITVYAPDLQADRR